MTAVTPLILGTGILVASFWSHAEHVQSRAQVQLVEIQAVDPSIAIDLRYASARNAFGRRLYPTARALLRQPVAQRLARAQARLGRQGLGLKVWDAYRPHSVQRRMWVLKPGSRFLASPRRGSRHSRGAAVDVTLVDHAGRTLPMPTDFDEFSRRAHPTYRGGPRETRRNRATLRRAMEASGFRQNPGEWWHYDDPQWRRYPLLDVPLTARVRQFSPGARASRPHRGLQY